MSNKRTDAYQLYQTENPTFGLNVVPTERVPIWPDDYQHVANIYANCLEDVFGIGNGTDWHRFEELRPWRTMAVGDILHCPDGRWLVCATSGYIELAPRPILQPVVNDRRGTIFQ